MFEFTLAEALHMTVGRLRLEMSAAEFMDWARFFNWRAREQRWAAQKAAGRQKAASSARQTRSVGAS